MIAAVTGSTGYAGRFILHKLVSEGVQVRAWRRARSSILGLPDCIEWIEGDLGSPASMTALVGGADLLVHAALEHVPGRYRGGEGGDPGGFIRANVGGSLDLFEKARLAGVRRAVFLSSRAVFGSKPRNGLIADADPLSPDTHYGAAKAAVEAFVQSWAAQGWEVAALRPTGIYGVVEPLGRTKWYDTVRDVLSGKPSDVSRAGSEVHGRDVAEAVWLLLTAEGSRIAGRAFNCSDVVVSTRDIAELVQWVTGRSGPLPPTAAPPQNVMECRALAELGMRFGGRALFEETVSELAERCLREA